MKVNSYASVHEKPTSKHYDCRHAGYKVLHEIRIDLSQRKYQKRIIIIYQCLDSNSAFLSSHFTFQKFECRLGFTYLLRVPDYENENMTIPGP